MKRQPDPELQDDEKEANEEQSHVKRDDRCGARLRALSTNGRQSRCVLMNGYFLLLLETSRVGRRVILAVIYAFLPRVQNGAATI